MLKCARVVASIEVTPIASLCTHVEMGIADGCARGVGSTRRQVGRHWCCHVNRDVGERMPVRHRRCCGPRNSSVLRRCVHHSSAGGRRGFRCGRIASGCRLRIDCEGECGIVVLETSAAPLRVGDPLLGLPLSVICEPIRPTGCLCGFLKLGLEVVCITTLENFVASVQHTNARRARAGEAQNA